MSTVRETRHRLLLEYLERLADQLRREESVEPAELKAHTVRLLTAVVMLLRQHRINKRGQCKFCTAPHWTWRFRHKQPQCTVYRALGFASGQRLDMVWQQLLDDDMV